MAEALSKVLDDLPEGQAVPLNEALSAFGARTHGCALLLLALPEAVPLPIPSVSILLGLPLIAISVHLIAFGETGGLPRRLESLRLSPGLAAALRNRVVPMLRRAERVSRPRWQAVTGQPRLLGLVCLWLSLLLLLPIPLFNTPPALCLVLLAWGMVQRDGAYVLCGLAGTVAVTAALGWVADRATVLFMVWAATLN